MIALQLLWQHKPIKTHNDAHTRTHTHKCTDTLLELNNRVKSWVKILSSVLDAVSVITGSWWIKRKKLVGACRSSSSPTDLCMLYNACLVEAREKQPWQHKGQTGSLLMGREQRWGLEEKGPMCWSWLGQQERLLLALIGSLHGGQVHGVSVLLSHPLLSPFLFLCFGEGAVMGHWSGLMAMSFWFFLPSFYNIPFPSHYFGGTKLNILCG